MPERFEHVGFVFNIEGTFKTFGNVQIFFRNVF
jgi:hypothetical protein